MRTGITFRSGRFEDADGLLALYQAVAVQPGSLARRADEMVPAFVDGVVASALARGVWLLAEDAQGLVGSIQASRPQARDFQHVLGELTLMVEPRVQGQGVGKALFNAFIQEVQDHEPGILRIELITRASNQRARRLYEGLGFQLEGRLRGRVRHPDGRQEDDLFYAWLRT